MLALLAPQATLGGSHASLRESGSTAPTLQKGAECQLPDNFLVKGETGGSLTLS